MFCESHLPRRNADRKRTVGPPSAGRRPCPLTLGHRSCSSTDSTGHCPAIGRHQPTGALGRGRRERNRPVRMPKGIVAADEYA